MLEPPVVFLDVDTQRDFLEADGALYVEGSAAILDNLARLTQHARTHEIPILATACAHTSDDPEFTSFPPHCLAGTRGQSRIDATAWPGGAVLGRDDRFDGVLKPHLTLEKQHFDVFTHPQAEAVFERYQQARPTFVVYGVATDYCVRAAVLGLLERGGKVAVVVDAVWAIDRDGEADVCTEFVRRGAFLTITAVVCAP